MITTMFLSMWITNTATTAMMVPIVEAVVSELHNEFLQRQELRKKKLIFIPNIKSMHFSFPKKTYCLHLDAFIGNILS